jgi:hypothetical protein
MENFGERCDAIIVAPGILVFAELKLNASSNNQKKTKKHRQKANNQLEASWGYFEGKYGAQDVRKDFGNIVAIRCMPKTYPSFSASQGTDIVKFTRENKIALIETNSYTLP